jgi:hypothetical protein
MEASAPRHRATDLVRVNCPRSQHAKKTRVFRIGRARLAQLVSVPTSCCNTREVAET